MKKFIKAKVKSHCDQLWKYSDLCCNYDPTMRPKFADLAESIGPGSNSNFFPTLKAMRNTLWLKHVTYEP